MKVLVNTGKDKTITQTEFNKDTWHSQLGHPIILIDKKTNSNFIIFLFQTAFKINTARIKNDIVFIVEVKQIRDN